MHDCKLDGSIKSDQSRQGSIKPDPKAGGRKLGSKSSDAERMGDRASLAETIGDAALVADSLSRKPSFFNFDAKAVRVVGTPEAPFFVASDICSCLELERTDSSLRALDDDEKGTHTVSTLGGNQQMSCVNESGLYSLIFRSRKPSARIFRRWVTQEVLPAIRRTGSYSVPSGKSEAVKEVYMIRQATLPPPIPKPDGWAAQLISAALGWRPRDCVRPSRLARVAHEHGLYQHIITDPDNPRQVSHLLVTLRPFFRKWILASQDSAVSITPVGRNRHRRYILMQQQPPTTLVRQDGKELAP